MTYHEDIQVCVKCGKSKIFHTQGTSNEVCSFEPQAESESGPKKIEVLDTSCPKCGWIKQASDYERGFVAGAASRDARVDELEAQVARYRDALNEISNLKTSEHGPIKSPVALGFKAKLIAKAARFNDIAATQGDNLKEVACIAYLREVISRARLAQALGVSLVYVGRELKRMGFDDPHTPDDAIKLCDDCGEPWIGGLCVHSKSCPSLQAPAVVEKCPKCGHSPYKHCGKKCLECGPQKGWCGGADEPPADPLCAIEECGRVRSSDIHSSVCGHPFEPPKEICPTCGFLKHDIPKELGFNRKCLDVKAYRGSEKCAECGKPVVYDILSPLVEVKKDLVCQCKGAKPNV